MAQHSSLEPLHRSHERLLEICDELEAIADGLPDRVPAARCQVLAGAAVAALLQAHESEEQLLLPMLGDSPRPELRQLAARLRREHEFDGETVMEVEEALLALAAGQPNLSPDAIGYLLRSFFESLRRHIQSEQNLLMLLGDLPPDRRSLH